MLTGFTGEVVEVDILDINTTDLLIRKGIATASTSLREPRQCSIYRDRTRRATVYATLQTTPLEIVYPCGSSGTR
jgi:hypothetical protein